MNGTSASLAEIDGVCDIASKVRVPADILLCPPATLISRATQVARGRIGIGGQDCHEAASGAFTGDISAEMLRDAGAIAVIVGHSERRQFHREKSSQVAAKGRAAWRAGLLAIICIGETESERLAGGALDICKDQLAASVPEGASPENTAIAYEPVWAIGTGRTPSFEDIVTMHRHIRHCLTSRFGCPAGEIRVLYGGSVKPGNAAEILQLPEVGGALVGGASLRAEEFAAIFSSVRGLA